MAIPSSVERNQQRFPINSSALSMTQSNSPKSHVSSSHKSGFKPMAYNSPSQWPLSEKDWNTYYPTSQSSSTPVSSWGTGVIHSPTSYHSIPQSLQVPYVPNSSAASSVYSPSQTSMNGLSYQTIPPIQISSPASSQFSNGPELHPALRYGAAHTLRFDTASTQFPSSLPLDPQTSAFRPPISQITIEFQNLWKFQISVSPGGYISVYNLLEGVYRHCRAELRREQISEMPKNLRSAANGCYQNRIHRQRSQAAPPPMIVLDYLVGNTLFVGLSPKAQDPSTWTVHFGRSTF